MSISLIQRTDGATVGNPIDIHFDNPTQLGSLVVCLMAGSIVGSGTHPVPVIDPPTCPGFTWKRAADNGQVVGTPQTAEAVAIYYIDNCPVMSPGDVTHCSGTISGTGTPNFGCQLLEFGPGSDLNSIAAFVAANGVTPNQATAGNLTTDLDGFILCLVTDPNFNTGFSAGPGYTLISTGGIGTAFARSQFQSVSPGTYLTAFNPPSTSGAWTMVAVAFGFLAPPPPPPPPTVRKTFKRVWRESDHCCGVIEGSPTIYRSGSAQDEREGKFVGLPEQSWDPVDIETFPTGAPVTGGQGYQEQSLVYSTEDSGVLSELASELGWQGPWNVGASSQFAYTKGWKGLPFVLTGEKQLATAGTDGPVPISDEYEAALLSKIGDQHLADAEMVYVRLPKKRVEVLRMNLLDSDSKPFSVIHDFNLRDDVSPYGQAYEETLSGPITLIEFWDPAQLQLTRSGGSVSVQRVVPSAVLLTPSVGDLAIVEGGTSFDGQFAIESVDVTPNSPTSFTITLMWSQTGINETAAATLTVKNSKAPHTLAVVRGENQQVLVLAGGSDGNLYQLYDGISDVDVFFTADALALRYLGPQRSGVKYLEWYGDPEARFFAAKKLTTPASTSEMEALCDAAGSVEEVQDDPGSNHWIVDVSSDIEMRHAYVWLQLTGRATSPAQDPNDPNNTIEVPNTMDLNDPPHMPMEVYGRVLMVSPQIGASRPK